MQLEKIKKQISEIKTNLAIKRNERDKLLSELNENYSIGSLEQAEKRMIQLKEKINKLKTRKESLLEKIEANLELF